MTPFGGYYTCEEKKFQEKKHPCQEGTDAETAGIRAA